MLENDSHSHFRLSALSFRKEYIYTLCKGGHFDSNSQFQNRKLCCISETPSSTSDHHRSSPNIISSLKIFTNILCTKVPASNCVNPNVVVLVKLDSTSTFVPNMRLHINIQVRYTTKFYVQLIYQILPPVQYKIVTDQ